MNPIEAAVAPLKDDAIKSAEIEANKIIAHVAEALKAHGGDLNKAAPYPDAFRVSAREYNRMKSMRNLFYSLVKTSQTSYMPDAPLMAVIVADKKERFIQGAKDTAAAQYDAFVAKLTYKIGDCDSAELDGNHVWSYSILTVKKGDVIERWKTRHVHNISKLGTLFPQWPTRKVK